MGHFVRAARPLIGLTGGRWSRLYSPCVWWVINLLNSAGKEGSEFLRCLLSIWCSQVLQSTSHTCSAFANQALTAWGVVKGFAHLESSAPGAAALCWKSWWRCCLQELNACLHALHASRARYRQEQCQPYVLILFVSHYIFSHHVLFFWSECYLELLQQKEPLCWSVTVLFICSFLWLERKISNHENGLLFPIAVSLVVIIFEAILVSLCVPLNHHVFVQLFQVWVCGMSLKKIAL